ncbi:MAG: hypothetical protein IT233_09930 [Bacteroidia bacterium]|nr:hypothetical protein [Bacteroidia bacterium]
MNLKTLFPTLLAVSFTAGLISCGGQESEVKPLDYQETKDSVNFGAQISMDLISVNFPSPSALGKKMSNAGISYNKGLFTSSSKSYSTKPEQAFGMGVLGAALGYACAFNNPQDALEYLGAVGRLAEQVGVASAFDQDFNKQLISSLGKTDTQDVMIDHAYKKAERHMRSNERMQLAGLMVLGGWVEGLYLATEMLHSKKDDPKAKGLYMEVWNYVSAYQHVRKLLDEYKGNADYKTFNEAFTESESVLKNMAYNTTFGPKDLDTLRETVLKLRGKVVK